jgi:hypothetical protein
LVSTDVAALSFAQISQSHVLASKLKQKTKTDTNTKSKLMKRPIMKPRVRIKLLYNNHRSWHPEAIGKFSLYSY